MTKSKLRFHKQETPYSCVPACLRIVLLSFDKDVSEADLRAHCDCTVLGTNAVTAIEAVRQLGFPRTAKYNLTRTELEACIKQELLPIVFVNTLPIDGVKGEHALVVIEVSETEVTVYHPLLGERRLPRHTFDTRGRRYAT